MSVVQTPDGKIHTIICDNDIAEIIEEYCGREVAQLVISNDKSIHCQEEYESLKKEFDSYEADLDSAYSLLHEVRAQIEQVVDEVENKARLQKSRLIKKLMDIDRMILRET